MSVTIHERDMLKTAVPERDMSVTTWLHTRALRPSPPWTAIWVGSAPELAWLHFWQGPTTPGGLAEAHEHIVEQVQRGEVPAPGRDRAAWGALADRRADDPATYDRRRTAREGLRPIHLEEA